MKKAPLALSWVATVLVLLATAVTLFFGRDYFYGGSIAGIVVSVIIPIIAVILIIIVWVQYEKQRTKEFKQVAEEMGFIFYPKGDDTQLRIGVTARLSDFHLFSQGRSRKIRNMLHGVSEQLEVGIFGYQYTTGGGQSSDTVRQSVIYFRSPELNLPQFALRPENLFHNIGGVFGYQDIDFDSHPQLSKKYLLRGNDEQKVRQLFTTEVLGFFEGQDGVSTDGGGDQLIFYRR